jgi:TIR domain
MKGSHAVDFALSYAGENESVAREVSTRLQKLGFEVFFARERSYLLVGLDGESVFEGLFSTAKQVVVFISAHYKRKEWTRYEWDVIRGRDLANRFIPVRLDDTKILGLSSNILYLRFDGTNYEQIVRTCAMRLLAYEEQAGIRRDTEFERVLRAIHDDSEGELAKAYQLVADARTRDPLENIEIPAYDSDPKYEIAKQEWCDFSRIRRLIVRAVVPPNLSQDELVFNLEHCAAQALNEFKPDAVMVLGYKDDPYGYTVDGHFTAARVILAPNGKWEDAEDGFAYNLPIDAFRYSIEFDAAYYTEALPTEERDREIFWRLVEQQDAISMSAVDYGDLNENAKVEIAEEYGIAMDELNGIIRRGAEQYWPTPPSQDS